MIMASVGWKISEIEEFRVFRKHHQGREALRDWWPSQNQGRSTRRHQTVKDVTAEGLWTAVDKWSLKGAV